MRRKHPVGALAYAGAMALAAILVLHLRLLPQLTEGFPGLLALWALGYGITDAGLLTAYTLVRTLRPRG